MFSLMMHASYLLGFMFGFMYDFLVIVEDAFVGAKYSKKTSWLVDTVGDKK
jgi:hypothetical protein